MNRTEFRSGKISKSKLKRKQKNKKRRQQLRKALKISKESLGSEQPILNFKSLKRLKFVSSEIPGTASTVVPPSNLSAFDVGQQALEWMLLPIKPTSFLKKYWEKGFLVIHRCQENYWREILTTGNLDDIIKQNFLFYNKNVDVVSYEDEQIHIHNPGGRAVTSALWKYYEQGYSIQIRNLQTYYCTFRKVLAALQECFGCNVNVNTYLTPPASQGCGPHYHDYDAFVLQLEGRKQWKLYTPLTEKEILPTVSRKNIKRNTLEKPIKEIMLEAGDLLYLPRGTIHEAHTDAESHSLHITLSVYHRTAYVDLLEHILKPALAAAAENDVAFREGLPIQYLKHVGLSNAGSSSKVRQKINTNVQSLFGKMLEYISIDDAADEMGKQFIQDAIPPQPVEKEQPCMVHKGGEQMSKGKTYNTAKIHLGLKVRLVRYHCLRMMTDENSENNVRIYYSTENVKNCKAQNQEYYMVINKAFAPVIQCLLKNYPKFVTVKSLPFTDDLQKMQLIYDFWEKGLLVTEQPM